MHRSQPTTTEKASSAFADLQLAVFYTLTHTVYPSVSGQQSQTLV